MGSGGQRSGVTPRRSRTYHDLHRAIHRELHPHIKGSSSARSFTGCCADWAVLLYLNYV